MKTSRYIKLTFIATLLLVSTSILAQNSDNTLYIKGANFTHPILNAWINEYSKVNPNVVIKVADRNTNSEAIDISVVTNENQIKNPAQQSLQVARYAILPVANKQNPLFEEINNKGLDRNKLKQLFFEKDIDDSGKYPFKNEVTIYSGSLEASNSEVISGYFGKTGDQLRGKKIAGDDIFLINALKKDESGVAFNYLSYIYDTKTRELKENIAILPIDLKKDQWQAVNSGIDATLSLLEGEKINLIPIETVSLAFDEKLPKEVQSFIEWIVTDGQKLNHVYGFLNIDSKEKRNIQQQIINYASLEK
ncbi:hypothetical protein [Dysgonomonas sp. GY617]|uniref:hypothetical protein n=1 Tax=Dysgonomonas sp. GY617 TaxID=2780420 RepID=UPI00188429BD|nr:hypothetical protein [Dysgonomonas sp. GY617]MBF0577418.1 hypothetical protein [Dysgonomonas sp. GY617]